MSAVTGVDQVLDGIRAFADDLTDLGDALADAARAQNAKHTDARAQLAPPVTRFDGTTLTYSGVIYEAGFQTHLATQLDPAAAAAVDDAVDRAIQRADLT